MEETSAIGLVLANIGAVLAVILLFGFSVFVHEFGHFIAARRLGLVVDVFSIGFGPAIWKRKKGDLTLRVSAIPFGGYVALPQLDPSGMEAVQAGEGGQAPRALPPIHPWKKIVVSLCGAAGNIVFAVLLAWIVYLADTPLMPGLEGAVVGAVEQGTPAWEGGLRPGDTVLAANGQDVKTWNDFIQICSLNNAVDLRVRHSDGTEAAMSLATSTNANAFDIRMLEGVEQGSICKVGIVAPHSMAEKAGVKSGDVIKSFNGQVVAGRVHLIEMVQTREGRPTSMIVERDGRRVELEVTPVMDPELKRIRIGIEFAMGRATPMEQIKQDATGVFRILKALVTPTQAGNAAKSIGGPLSIFAAFWLYAKAGLLLLLGFARFVNVNLAILNLLPIPVLDGGHVLFSLWEWITGKAPGEKVVRVLINGFAAILIGLIVLLSFRDVKIIRRLMNLVNDPPPTPAPIVVEPPAPGGGAP